MKNKNTPKSKMPGVFFTTLLLLALSTTYSFAFFIDSRPITETQPNGRVLHLFVSGDEYYHWVHDKAKYTIVKNERNYLVYAQLSGELLAPSGYVVGETDPTTTELVPGLKPGPSFFENLRQKSEKEHKGDEERVPFLHEVQRSASSNARFGAATMNPLVIFIRFAGETEFGAQRNTFLAHFNTNANSLKGYYEYNSYNELSITSNIVGGANATIVSYQSPRNRGYFRTQSATNPDGYTAANEHSRRQELFRSAYEGMRHLVPSTLNLDANNDERIDMVFFVIKGSQDNWADILWPHRSSFSSTLATNGVTPRDYMCVFETWHDVGLLAHETGHVLGAPDLYRASSPTFHPAGVWECMASQTDPPQSMTAYVKHKYMGFINDIPEITTSGTYTLSPVGTHPVAYKIASTTPNEFFVVEYRRKTASGYESQIPGSGLIIYRINTNRTGNINPPYELYVYRKDGLDNETNGDLFNAFFSSNSGRTVFNDQSSPYGFMTNGELGHLNISNIGSAGNTISFTYTRNYCGVWNANLLTYTSSTVPAYSAAKEITNQGSVVIDSNQKAKFYAERVVLKPGFKASNGSSFRTDIQVCKNYQPIPNVAPSSSGGGGVSSNNDNDPVVLGVEEGLKKLSFSLQPNPAHTSINVSFRSGIQGASTIQIYSTSGTLMTTIESDKIQEITTIPVQGYQPGVYIVKVTNNETVLTDKFQVL